MEDVKLYKIKTRKVGKCQFEVKASYLRRVYLTNDKGRAIKNFINDVKTAKILTREYKKIVQRLMFQNSISNKI